MREGNDAAATAKQRRMGATYDGHGVNFTFFRPCGARRACVLIPEGMSVAMTRRDVAAMSGMVIWRRLRLWLSHMARGSQRRASV